LSSPYGAGMPAPYGEDKKNPKAERRNYQKVPVIIGSFKSAVSKLIHASGNDSFNWHRSYYDHIIRNENDLARIRKYIMNNPLKWELGKNDPEYIHEMSL
jgi:putative transposase